METKRDNSVWAAEHGSSSPLGAGADEGANAGHRWRIHGRLDDEETEHGSLGATDRFDAIALSDEQVRRLLAQGSEVDMRDVSVSVEGDTVTLTGTVSSDNERRDLEASLLHVPGVRNVRNDLRTQVA